MVPASELYSDLLNDEATSATPTEPDSPGPEDSSDPVLSGAQDAKERGPADSNRDTVDDSTRQTLTADEIEELKRAGTAAGKDLIAKLLLSHTAIDQTTTFSLAK